MPTTTTKAAAAAALTVVLVLAPITAYAAEDSDLVAASTSPTTTSMNSHPEPVTLGPTLEAPATPQPIADEPSAAPNDVVVGEPTTTVDVTSFGTAVTRVDTGLAPGRVVTVTALPGASLPALDAARFATTEAQRGLVATAVTESRVHGQEGEDLGDGAALNALISTIYQAQPGDFQWDAAQVAAAMRAQDAMNSQIAANRAAGLSAEPINGLLQLVVLPDGAVVLPAGVLQFDFELPFDGDASADPAASWRTARFVLSAQSEQLSPLAFGGAASGYSAPGSAAAPTAFADLYEADQDPSRFAAGIGFGTGGEYAGSWLIGPALSVNASLASLPAATDPAPDPAEPTSSQSTAPTIPTVIATGDEGPTLGGILGIAILAMQTALLPAVALRRRLAHR